MDDRHARYRRGDFDRRRRPSEGFRVADTRRFQRLVDDVLASLPAKLLAYLERVDVVLEDVPPSDALRSGEIPLGVYESVPVATRGSGPPTPTGRVTLYRRPLESRVTGKEELVDLIREVVVHELADHFGIDDDRLDELG